MKINIDTKAYINAFLPDSIESLPSDGLTDRSSTILTGASSSQALKTITITWA